MLFRKSKKTSISSERGAAIVEGAAVLPFLVMMILATYDLGGALNQYLTLTRIVYEGARYAATLPGLETNHDNGDEPYKIISGSQAGPIPMNQSLVRQRIVDLLGKSSFQWTSFTLIQTGNDQNIWVSITLEKPYESFFGFFNNMPIRVSASGPYLSQRPTSS